MGSRISQHFVYNGDDVFINWDVDGDGIIPFCLGFAIQREMTRGGKTASDWLLNRVGFADQPAKPNETHSSEVWPFQRYDWSDHEVTAGDVVRYRVCPVLVDASGKLKTREDMGTGWSDPLTISASVDESTSVFFNRAVSASQFVARYLKDHKLTQKQLADEVKKHQSSLRSFMGGPLLAKLESLLDEVAAAKASDKREIYASLFELRDQELIDRLIKIGRRAHIVLADGSPKAKDPDPNIDARKALKKAKVEVINRKVAWDAVKKKKTGALSHNKFFVFTTDGKATTVGSGSTNWTPSGLCTQINNAVLIENPGLADLYLTQWKRLANAKSKPPSSLAATNAAPAPFTHNGQSCEVWFTPDQSKIDLKQLVQIVHGANDGILFLMFMPGDTPLGDIVKQAAAGRYVRGVVNQYVSSATNAITLYSKGQVDQWKEHAPNPEGIKHEFAYWLSEVQKNTLGVLIHSKLIVVDPFGSKPVVVVGSHNFSGNASEKNDENLLVLRNQPVLARAYATNIVGIYEHYRWRYYANTHPDPWHKLSTDPKWQVGYQTAEEKKERDFWTKA